MDSTVSFKPIPVRPLSSSFSSASLGQFGLASNGGVGSTALSTSTTKGQEESSRLTLEEFSAWVQVDDRPLDCFLPYANKKEKEASCWIASVAGEEFSVIFRKNEVTKCHCDVNLYLDGSRVSENVLYMGDVMKTTFKYAWSSPTTKHTFKFAPIELVDGEAQLQNVRQNKDSDYKSGEIRLVVTRITRLKEEKPNTKKGPSDDSFPEDSEKWEVPKPRKLYEGSGGKIVHQVVLLNARFTDEIKEESLNYIFDSHEDIATFVFRYRAQETLEQSQIIKTPTTTARMPGITSSSSTRPSRQSSIVEAQGTATLASSTPSMTQQEQSVPDDAPPSQRYPPAPEDSALREAQVCTKSSKKDVPTVMSATVSTPRKRRTSASNSHPEYDSTVSESRKRIKLEPWLDEEVPQQPQLGHGVKKEGDEDIQYVEDVKRLERLQAEIEEIESRIQRRRVERQPSPIVVSVPGEVIDLT